MKHRLLITLAVTAVVGMMCEGCAAMAARRAAREAELKAAREAVYALPRDKVLRATLSVLLGRYEIERNVVERGYMETKIAIEDRGTKQYRTRVMATLEGDGPYRVVFEVDTYRREVDAGQTTPWMDVEGTEFEDALYVDLYRMLERSGPPSADTD